MSLRLLNHALRDFERAFTHLEEPFARSLLNPTTSFTRTLPTQLSSFRPLVDLSETAKEYQIEADLPGARREDIDVEFQDGNTIILKGTIGTSSPVETSTQAVKEAPSVDATSDAVVEPTTTTKPITSSVESATHVEQPTYWERERLFGSFRRAFTFPTSIDAERVKATFRDGVLSVKVPKLEQKVNKIVIGEQ
ncbi:hypothetical protein HK097_004351 [Rhizophlyctis rosea]|uniref:SHSP domain-containing protein n=1 Tax=Rhizophlyctis rosea TaxID=64517 RepID=A0AAD5SFL8_9FUNG|nr:hypothetical protein HK097_004351 [Rhizophlyctis rosea]